MLILQSHIYRADLRANPSILYVFGDNVERWGRGGQAAQCRDEPNAVGVATLWSPGRFFSDDRATEQNAIIDKDMAPLFKAVSAGIVVFPLAGIGTGLADLERQSPATWRHLQFLVAELKSYMGNE